MSVSENRKILEKLRRLERLARAATTEGERQAAEAARRRLVESLQRQGVHVDPALRAAVGARRLTADIPMLEPLEAPTDPFEASARTVVGAEPTVDVGPQDPVRGPITRPGSTTADMSSQDVLSPQQADHLRRSGSMPPGWWAPPEPVEPIQRAPRRNRKTPAPPREASGEARAWVPPTGPAPAPRSTTPAYAAPAAPVAPAPPVPPRAAFKPAWLRNVVLLGLAAFFGVEVAAWVGAEPDGQVSQARASAQQRELLEAVLDCRRGASGCDAVGARLSGLPEANDWADRSALHDCISGSRAVCIELGQRFARATGPDAEESPTPQLSALECALLDCE